MSSSLTDLFAQIIDSERRAHERKTYLQEVRNKVRQKEADILQLKQEKEVLRKELEVKIAELNKVDVNLILVNNRKEILTNQKSQLQKERQDFEDQLENLEEELFHVNERFCSDVETFVTEYGLLGNGADIRRDEALRQIEGLSAEKNQLHQEIRDYEERMESLRILRDKETDLMDLLQITKAKNSELCEKVAEEKRKLLQQEEEKQSIQLLPTTDADFIRLQTELDSVKEEDLEAKCHHLQQQVQSLQQQLWQRKVKDKHKYQSSVKHHQTQTSRQTASNLNEDLKVSTSNRMCVSSFTATTGANQTQNEAVDELKVDNLEDIFDDDLNLNLPQQNDTKPVKKQHIFRKGHS
ncbi:coiled-coil domain-containing protein 172-like isoform X2 [Argopecten irradians]|uniref:coiled-coil domain-containing protein 172-like isoform X2 n=1 Tax=Argopecten irradians TaxID=31199 RepID=UPI00371908CF